MELLTLALIGLLAIGAVGTGLIMIAAQIQDAAERRHHRKTP